MLKHLLPLIPAHHTYVEPFFGGGAVFFAKRRSPVEVINDISNNIVNLLRQVKYHPRALCEELNFRVASRSELIRLRGQKSVTELQSAADFLQRIYTSFGGGGSSFAVSRACPANFNPSKLKDRILEVSAFLEKTTIENLSYERIFKNYDSPDSFFFIDPPYANPAGHYAGFDLAATRLLVDRVRSLKGKWICTLNDSAANRALFSGCKIFPVATASGTANSRHKLKFGEIIVRGFQHANDP